MTEAQLIRANLSAARKELVEVFPRLTDEMLAWAPTDGMRTIHGQMVEILATEQGIIEELQKLPKKSYEELEGPFWALKNVEALVAKFDKVRGATLQFLDSLDESGLKGEANISHGYSEWLDLNPAPVSEMLRYIARHESYHAGQLVSYLWARGDNPYEWKS